jgi:glycosyltransferase involved in cell wall biosynthesis
MKVVVLHPPLYPVNHQLYNLLGKEVDLIVYNYGEHPRLHPTWTVDKYKNKNYTIKVFGKGAISLRVQLDPRVLIHLIKDKPDVVISVAFWLPSLFASLLKRILGYKLLISTDAIHATETNISKIKQRIRKVISNNTDAYISASSLTTMYLHELYPKVPTFKSLQVIDIVNWCEEYDSLAVQYDLRKKLNLPIKMTILLGVGAFTAKKNWKVVFSQLIKLPDCAFVLIGEGELEEQYLRYISEKNLGDRVFIISRKEGKELKEYFKAANIFIFPSLWDQFGYVVAEALCSGLPVICTKHAGSSSLITKNKNGYIIDPKKEFFHEIKLIIANEINMKVHAASSMKKYTMENKASEFYSIIEEVYEKK